MATDVLPGARAGVPDAAWAFHQAGEQSAAGGPTVLEQVQPGRHRGAVEVLRPRCAGRRRLDGGWLRGGAGRRRTDTEEGPQDEGAVLGVLAAVLPAATDSADGPGRSSTSTTRIRTMFTTSAAIRVWFLSEVCVGQWRTRAMTQRPVTRCTVSWAATSVGLSMGAEEAIAAAADDHRIRAVVAEDAGTSTFADATSAFCTSAEAIMLLALWLTFTRGPAQRCHTKAVVVLCTELRLSGGIHSRGPSSHFPVGGSVDRQEHHCQSLA